MKMSTKLATGNTKIEADDIQSLETGCDIMTMSTKLATGNTKIEVADTQSLKSGLDHAYSNFTVKDVGAVKEMRTRSGGEDDVQLSPVEIPATSTSKKQYKCRFCDATFSTRWNCLSHMRAHTRVRPVYICPKCGKKCSKISEFDIHMRIHNGEKPFKCGVCARMFIRQGQLNSHMLIHTGFKPHMCAECGTQFASISNLKRHQRKHPPLFIKGKKKTTASPCTVKMESTSDVSDNSAFENARTVLFKSTTDSAEPCDTSDSAVVQLGFKDFSSVHKRHTENCDSGKGSKKKKVDLNSLVNSPFVYIASSASGTHNPAKRSLISVSAESCANTAVENVFPITLQMVEKNIAGWEISERVVSPLTGSLQDLLAGADNMPCYGIGEECSVVTSSESVETCTVQGLLLSSGIKTDADCVQKAQSVPGPFVPDARRKHACVQSHAPEVRNQPYAWEPEAEKVEFLTEGLQTRWLQIKPGPLQATKEEIYAIPELTATLATPDGNQIIVINDSFSAKQLFGIQENGSLFPVEALTEINSESGEQTAQASFLTLLPSSTLVLPSASVSTAATSVDLLLPASLKPSSLTFSTLQVSPRSAVTLPSCLQGLGFPRLLAPSISSSSCGSGGMPAEHVQHAVEVASASQGQFGVKREVIVEEADMSGQGLSAAMPMDWSFLMESPPTAVPSAAAIKDTSRSITDNDLTKESAGKSFRFNSSIQIALVSDAERDKRPASANDVLKPFSIVLSKGREGGSIQEGMNSSLPEPRQQNPDPARSENINNGRDSSAAELLHQTVITAGGENADQGKLRPFQCDHCHQTFTRRCYVNMHMRTHGKPEVFHCDKCPAEFSRVGNLNRHNQTVHLNIRQFKCSHCEATFCNKYRLVGHEKRHEGLRPFKCHICRSAFADSSSMKRHLNTHTGEGLKHTCAQCGASFRTQHSLTFHVKLHSRDEDTCVDEFIAVDSTQHLPQDLPILTVDVPKDCTTAASKKLPHVLKSKDSSDSCVYTCSVCSKRFLSSVRCRQHLFCHTGSRPYCCTDCGAKFSRKADARRHTVVHQKAKRFKCKECFERFHSRSRLLLHQDLHRTASTFTEKCTLCKLTFSSQTVLKTHRKLFHRHKVTFWNQREVEENNASDGEERMKENRFDAGLREDGKRGDPKSPTAGDDSCSMQRSNKTLLSSSQEKRDVKTYDPKKSIRKYEKSPRHKSKKLDVKPKNSKADFSTLEDLKSAMPLCSDLKSVSPPDGVNPSSSSPVGSLITKIAHMEMVSAAAIRTETIDTKDSRTAQTNAQGHRMPRRAAAQKQQDFMASVIKNLNRKKNR